jgi:hypothetical protein
MKRRLLIHKAPILRRPCANRIYSTSTTADSGKSSTPTPSPNGATLSHKPRKWGNRALPLSPLMDPVKIEQRNKHKKPKLPPPKNADLTPFQKALVNNPYGEHEMIASLASFKVLTTRSPRIGDRRAVLQNDRSTSSILLPNPLRNTPTPRATTSFECCTQQTFRRSHSQCPSQETSLCYLGARSPICHPLR